MFFSPDVLVRREGFSLIWRLAMYRKSVKVANCKRAISDIKITSIIEQLLERIPTEKGHVKEQSVKYSLYLLAQLLYGSCIVQEIQLDFLIKDAENWYKSCKRIVIAIETGVKRERITMEEDGNKSKRQGRRRRRSDCNYQEDEDPSQSLIEISRALRVRHIGDITLRDEPPVPIRSDLALEDLAVDPDIWRELLEMADMGEGLVAKETTQIGDASQLTMSSSDGEPAAKRKREDDEREQRDRGAAAERQRPDVTRRTDQTLDANATAPFINAPPDFEPPPVMAGISGVSGVSGFSGGFGGFDMDQSRSMFGSAPEAAGAAPPEAPPAVPPVVDVSSQLAGIPFAFGTLSPVERVPPAPLVATPLAAPFIPPQPAREEDEEEEAPGRRRREASPTDRRSPPRVPGKRKLIIDEETSIDKKEMQKYMEDYESLLDRTRGPKTERARREAEQRRRDSLLTELNLCLASKRVKNPELQGLWKMLLPVPNEPMSLEEALSTDLYGFPVDDSFCLPRLPGDELLSDSEDEEEREQIRAAQERYSGLYGVPMISDIQQGDATFGRRRGDETMADPLGFTGDEREAEFGQKISRAIVMCDWADRMPREASIEGARAADIHRRSELHPGSLHGRPSSVLQDTIAAGVTAMDMDFPPMERPEFGDMAMPPANIMDGSVYYGSAMRSPGTAEEEQERQEGIERRLRARPRGAQQPTMENVDIRDRIHEVLNESRDKTATLESAMPRSCNAATATRFFFQLLDQAKQRKIVPEQDAPYGTILMKLAPPHAFPVV